MSSLMEGSHTLTDEELNLNFTATFDDAVTPFTVSVKKEFLKLTKLKASLTRFAEYQDQYESEDGPFNEQAKIIAKYWAEDHDWSTVEAKINSRFRQFTTIVYTKNLPNNNNNYPGPIPLHFVHHRSPRADAIPLLFVHGWPGSFLEVENLLDSLTNPPSASHPAFHVVAPSVPGYGFSPAPRRRGFGYRQAGATFHALMAKLGYDRYVFQGGDLGDFVNRYAAADFPGSVVSGLSNFWIVPPDAEDLARLAAGEVSADERCWMEGHQAFITKGWGYGFVQQTQPLRLAAGLTDSPVGLAMWIYYALAKCVPDPSVWTPELVVTWTMMHWIPGPYGGFGMYKNGAKDGTISTQQIGLNLPYIHQPIAISEFPYDSWYRLPLQQALRAGNVKQRKVHTRGGHFAAFDAADLLLEDIWQFFGDKELSGTKIFFEE
ncbi:Alpha/Beta hydrolase protein [Xylariales sp. PMI_506]|nr:Alpha/Beta hydrolase protein [Xylariales sp. PMI_506]